MMLRTTIGIVMLVVLTMGSSEAEDPASAWEVSPAFVGTSVPDLSFEGEGGQTLSVKALAADKPLILVIYRGLW